MNRLFTFGCSFTQYWRWPTWADVLGRQFDHYENWGLCGAGNSYIFNSLMECHRRNRISASDTIMIMWSNTSREDRYVKDRWHVSGNVYWEKNPLGPEYVRQWACERGYLIRDLAIVEACQNLLDYWQCKWRMFAMVPLYRTNFQNDLGDHPINAAGPDDDVRELYRGALDQIEPSVLEVVFNGKFFTGDGIPNLYDGQRRDMHPTPIEHLAYLDKVASDIAIDSQHREWMQECEHLARQGRLEWSEPNRPQIRL